MSQNIVTIRMDETLKRNFDYICEELGMNMSTAINIFAKKVCREKRIPFEISIDNNYNNGGSNNMAKTTYKVCIWPENDSGKAENVTKTFDNLDEALKYLIEKRDEMDRTFLLDLDAHCIAYWGIEFINPEYMYPCRVVYGDEFVYENNNMTKDLRDIFEDYMESDEDFDVAVCTFIKALDVFHATK